MKLTRRDMLKYGLMGAAGLALPGYLYQQGRSALRSPEVALFSVPLPIPPVLAPTRTDADTDYYELVQQEATAEILPGLSTAIWGYNGIFPGPTIEAKSGRQAVIRQTNALAVPVVTHLHGAVTAPESDGYPMDFILPADPAAHADHAHAASANSSVGFKDYTYPNQQRGATLWYHDHRMDFTGPQVYRGLAGMYIIRDDVEEQLPLPRGEKEIPLIIADRQFNEDGSFHYPSIDPSLTGEPGVTGNAHSDGMLGDTILVNGAPWPVLEVSNTRYRFRILNASNARIYRLGLDPPPSEGSSFTQIGSDGGLLTKPLGHDSIRVAPAERLDIIIDFSKFKIGDEITLRNLEVQDPFSQGRISNIMRFRVVREETDDSAILDQLAPEDEPLDPKSAVKTREFRFNRTGGDWAINDRTFDPDHIWADPKLDSTEIWEFIGTPGHPVHLHLVHFKVLDGGDGYAGGSNSGWKDTVLLGNRPVRVIAKFSGYRGKYVLHCHILEHEDMMMMANFEVV